MSCKRSHLTYTQNKHHIISPVSHVSPNRYTQNKHHVCKRLVSLEDIVSKNVSKLTFFPSGQWSNYQFRYCSVCAWERGRGRFLFSPAKLVWLAEKQERFTRSEDMEKKVIMAFCSDEVVKGEDLD